MRHDDLILVAGGGGFIGGHLVAGPSRAGLHEHPRRRREAVRRVVPALRRRRQPAARPRPSSAPPARRPTGVALRLQPRRRHGRHGVHREQQGRLHAVGADQHAPAAWPPATPASSASSTPRRRASTRPARQTSRRRRRRSREEDAYPAMPEDGYGWEKLFSERMARHFREDFGLADPGRPLPQRLRPARHVRRRPGEGAGRDLPQGDRGQARPASDTIEIWGDGEQTRSFMYIDDCVYGTQLLTASDVDRAAQHRQRPARHDQPAGRHRRGDRRRAASSAATTSTRRRACAAATATTPGSRRELGWAPSITPRGRARTDVPLDLRPARRHGSRLTRRRAQRTGARIDARTVARCSS